MHIHQLVQQLNSFFFISEIEEEIIWRMVKIMQNQWLIVLYIYNLIKDHNKLNMRSIADMRQIRARMIFYKPKNSDINYSIYKAIWSQKSIIYLLCEQNHRWCIFFTLSIAYYLQLNWSIQLNVYYNVNCTIWRQ